MSLFKQLLLLITAIFVVIFAVNFWTSVSNMRDYLVSESEIHAQDTATSLGLSLTPYIADPKDPLVERMIAAIFDRGYYKEIKLLDMEDKELIAKSNPESYEGVPAWFIKWLPMKTASAMTEISSGWNLAGKLYVTINPGTGYQKLYAQAKKALSSSLIAFVLFTLLLFFLLQLVLKPLKNIEQLARNIAEGNFGQIKEVPWTTEVKNVAIAMNFMSTKIEQMITNLNLKLDKVSEQLQLDDLTGLKNKDSFQGDMKKMFMTHEEGYVFFIRIDNLGEFSKQLGRDVVDEFLKKFAWTLLEKGVASGLDFNAYRLYGSEFAIILKSITAAQAESLGKLLGEGFLQLGQQYNKPDLAHIGIVPFDVGSSLPGILAASNEAYEQARLIGANAFFIYRRDEKSRDVKEWVELVERIIREKQFEVSYVGQVLGLHGEPGTLLEEAFAKVFDKEQPVPIGAFVSIAEKYGQIARFDSGIVQRVVNDIAEKNIPHAISINLSMSSVRNADFRAWLGGTIERHGSVANRTVFSVTAYSAAREIRQFEEFISFVHNIGAKVMLKRYETEFISLEQVKKLKPDYLRLSRDLTNEISTNRSKRLFVETMKEVSDLLDVKVIAENVKSDADFATIREIGIYGASR
jgi:EAL domain-containing protein (putative c-di-GMP-specific phosphodiesterase class I)/HAMP domain-containing protein